MKKAKVKQRVRLIGKKRVAVVTGILSDPPGGVELDRKLSGFRFWNVEDLELAAAKPIPKRREP